MALAGILLLYLRYVWVPAINLERYVWARVLEVDEARKGHVLVDFVYDGRTYEKSIDARERLKPGKAIILHFFGWDATEADWRTHKGGRGPYTKGGVLTFIIPFFVLGFLMFYLWKRFFKGLSFDYD